VVKNVDAAELRVVVAEVLAVVADAVLVAHKHSKLGSQLATALARLHVRNLARRSSPEAGSTRKKKGGGGGAARKNKIPVARARVSRTRE
jgi:hypothetical protein